jgi:hypothetical protein
MKYGGSIIMASYVIGLLGCTNLSAFLTRKHDAVIIKRATAIEAAQKY